ncbi:RNA polymerase sigma factor [uncultured Eubacterium sp.]|uniref:RNA polymerase sigma factor n=1 Tax=uncultured Eubacterium sp. TaxID=165185 RepID=UPI0026734A1B|nr:sigma-70 family RNA polymerase sigma factor [uncultured Eubacterium sp.]
MNKTNADALVLKYQKKIFGFAMDKMHNISDAEELAADIVCELYKSLINAKTIANTDGYVYRIAKNVYARYLNRENQHKHLDLMNIQHQIIDRNFVRLEEQETYRKLRQQIGLLSERQRAIIYMKYYKNMAIQRIAKELNISSGTVKWHLSDAKMNLKEKIKMEKVQNLSINPIKFIGMGHSGTPGTSGDTKDMFDSRLKQNIAWSCYYKAKNMEEIAGDIEVPIAYIEGELKKLVAWGYIDQIDNSKNPKFLTNMCITDYRLFDGTEIDLNKKAARFLCDNLFNKVFKDFDRAEDYWGFQCPGNDKNFIKYNLVMLIIKNLCENMWSDWDRFAVKRPDGGHFIAYATLSDDCTPIREDKYSCCGYMFEQVWRDEQLKMQVVQCNCRFSDREIDWRVNAHEDWDNLYSYMENGYDRNKMQMERYTNLCQKGYVLDEKIQVVTLNSKSNHLEEAMDEHIKKYVQIPDEVWKEGRNFNEKRFEINKKKYPKHLEELVKYNNSGGFSDAVMIPYVIEEMMKREMLQPLTEEQKKAVFTVVCCVEGVMKKNHIIENS